MDTAYLHEHPDGTTTVALVGDIAFAKAKEIIGEDMNCKRFYVNRRQGEEWVKQINDAIREFSASNQQ